MFWAVRTRILLLYVNSENIANVFRTSSNLCIHFYILNCLLIRSSKELITEIIFLLKNGREVGNSLLVLKNQQHSLIDKNNEQFLTHMRLRSYSANKTPMRQK